MSLVMDNSSFHRISPHSSPQSYRQNIPLAAGTETSSSSSSSSSQSQSHQPHQPPPNLSFLQSQHQQNQFHLYNSPTANLSSSLLQRSLAQAQQLHDPYAAADEEGDETNAASADYVGGKEDSANGPTTSDLTQSYYDPFRVKHRRRTSPPQLKVLEYHFEQNPKPDVALRKALSEQLDMTPREVQVWFQNRRAKTKKLREKMEKDSSDTAPTDNATFAIPPRRNSTAEISHMHSQAMPLQQPMNGNNHLDFHALRRGSSPAILSAGLKIGQQPSYEQYYDSLSRTNYPIQPPPPQARPQYYSSPPLAGAQTGQQQQQPSFYTSPLSLSTPALSSSSSSHSPTELADYPQQQQQQQQQQQHVPPPQPPRTAPSGLAPPFEDPSQAGRRFSLPAFTSPPTYPSVQWAPVDEPNRTTPTQQNFYNPPQHQTHSLPSSYSEPAAFPAVPYGAPPPANGYGAVRPGTASTSTDDYSPESSLDGHHAGSGSQQDFTNQAAHAYAGGVYGAPVPNGSFDSQTSLNQYTFGTMSHASSYEDSITPLSTDSFNFGSNGSSATSPGGPEGITSPGGRRSSCPAGFLPTFDNLGITSPVHPPPAWPPAPYQDVNAPGSHNPSPPLQPLDAANGQQQQQYIASGQTAYSASSMEAFLAGVPAPVSATTSLPPSVVFATQQQFLQNNQRRGSTSSALGTIVEQPGAGGYGADDLMEQNGSPGGVDRTPRKVRSQASLRAPYPQQDRRSPTSVHERRGSVPGYEYAPGEY